MDRQIPRDNAPFDVFAASHDIADETKKRQHDDGANPLRVMPKRNDG